MKSLFPRWKWYASQKAAQATQAAVSNAQKQGILPPEDVDKALEYYCQPPSKEDQTKLTTCIPDANFLHITNALRHLEAQDLVTGWSERPRIYTVLRIIRRTDIMQEFVEIGLKDISLPLSSDNLPLAISNDAGSTKDFLQAQQFVLTEARKLEMGAEGNHVHFPMTENEHFYTIRILGKGGFGYVDHVYSRLSFKHYARKRFRRGRGTERKIADMFERESGALRRLSHQHLVKIVGTYTDPLCMAMLIEPVAECNLSTFLDRNGAWLSSRLPALRTYFGCLASALNYLHTKSIRHRDLKPENILIKNNEIYITDFGTALDFSRQQSTTCDAQVPRTAKYMSPEVARNAPRNKASDIWSLGVVFLEMTTVLRGRSRQHMRNYLEKHGSGNSHVWNNETGTYEWFEVLQKSDLGPETDNEPLSWIKDMLQIDPINRPSARSLAKQIIMAGPWSGICCSHVDDDIEDEDNVSDQGETRKKSEFSTPSYFEAEMEFPEPPVGTFEAPRSQRLASWLESNIDYIDNIDSFLDPSVIKNDDIERTMDLEDDVIEGATMISDNLEVPYWLQSEMKWMNQGLQDKSNGHTSKYHSNRHREDTAEGYEILDDDSDEETLPYERVEDDSGSDVTIMPHKSVLHHNSTTAKSLKPFSDTMNRPHSDIFELNSIPTPEEVDTQRPGEHDIDNGANFAGATSVRMPGAWEEEYDLEDAGRQIFFVPAIPDESNMPAVNLDTDVGHETPIEVDQSSLSQLSDEYKVLSSIIERYKGDLNLTERLEIETSPRNSLDFAHRNQALAVGKGEYIEAIPIELDRNPITLRSLSQENLSQIQPEAVSIEDQSTKDNEEHGKSMSASMLRIDEGSSAKEKPSKPQAYSKAQSVRLTEANLRVVSKSGDNPSGPKARGEKEVVNKTPRFSPSIYMQQAWEAASSVGTSVMSDRTRSLFSPKVSYLKWQDREWKLLEKCVSAGKTAQTKHLLGIGCNPGWVDHPRPEVLLRAVEKTTQKHIKCAKLLLEYGANVNAKFPSRRHKTALHLAIEHRNFHGYTNLISLLLEHGADPNTKDDAGDLPILKLLYGGYEPLEKHRKDGLACLLQAKFGTDVNVSPPGTLNRPLHLAARRGDYEAIGMLLHRKARVNEYNGSGKSPLMLTMNRWTTIAHTSQKIALELLLEYEANINEQEADTGRTALHTAVSLGRDDLINILIAHGADTGLQDKNRMCPIKLAGSMVASTTIKKHAKIMTALFRNKNLDLGNDDLKDVCSIVNAVRAGREVTTRTLLGYGANSDHVGKDTGRPILHDAISTGNISLVRLLLNYGAKVKCTDLENRDALTVARESGFSEILDYLAQQNTV